jgi:lipopolysaccharide export system protein LptC
LVLNTGEKIKVTAEQGDYFHEERRVYLKTAVHLEHSQGYDFVTARATMDVPSSRIFGSDPVEGHGPTGMIHAKGFNVLDKGRSITFGEARVNQ